MKTPNELNRFRGNWQKEVDGAWLYRVLAKLEPKPELAVVYNKLAESEEKHAAVWESRLKEAGEAIPARKPTWRAQTMGFLAKRFGTQFVLSTLAGNEAGDSRAYNSQPEAKTSDGSMATDEKSHARLLAAAEGRRSGIVGSEIAQIEGRHRATGGNALRAAVLGANDGLVSILSLTMGAAGADLPGKGVLITGIAGLIAGAGSMALGEWLSVQSSRELYQNQIAIEAEEIDKAPREEQEELALIYQSKGMPKERADELAAIQMQADRRHILDTLAREELGINPEELGGSAWEAAVTSFLLFSAGAIVPIFPYIFWSGTFAIVLSLILGAVALFITGAAITLMTGRSVLYSGLRQVLIGMIAAVLTFGVGKLLGVSTGG